MPYQHSLFFALRLTKLTFAGMQKNNISIETILSNLKIEALNDMQQASVKANEESDNVILLSATGSGKTLAYLLPIVQLLKPELKKVQASFFIFV